MLSRASFLHYARQTVFPRFRADWPFLLAVLFSASSYWIASRAVHPDEPVSIVAMYRAGDIENYPFISAISRARLSESVVREQAGNGVAPFPMWSSLPHGLGLRIFGVAGFMLVDLLGFLAFYLACAAMLCRLRVNPLVARAVTVLIISGGLAWLGHLTARLPFLQSYPIALEFWGLRITRPFPSSILLCICAALFFSFLVDDRCHSRAWPWICFGISSAMLLQADPYSAVTFALCTPFLFLYILWRRSSAGRRLLRDVLLFIAAFVIFAVPCIVQRACELPDVSRRLGIFHVNRSAPLWLPYPNFSYLRAVWLVAICAAGLGRLSADAATRSERTRLTLGLAGLCTAAYLSLPLTCMITGEALQVYHFAIGFHTFVFLTLLAFALQALTAIIDAVRRYAAGPPRNIATTAAWPALVVVILIVSVAWSLERASRLAGRTDHTRSDFPEWQALGPTYRSDFGALVGELSKPRYADCEVVSTFDHQVYAWWAAFRPGYSFLPDAALSTLPDAAMEARLIALCRTIGMSGPRFQEFVRRRYVTIFWLGHAKYQASQAHTFAPLSDYTPEQQCQIAKTNAMGSWACLLPSSESDRLRRRFDSLSGVPLPGRLDLIILTNDESLAGLAPPDSEFEPTYRNATFRVWLRR
ncbi:MAG TPA: hypothetical protein VMV94_18170 [Phycisphaerae bacterium]|nr:hypothetical protein [Phycisphaerae bacterium]